MKIQANNTQKKVYVALAIISTILIVNFFSFGFLFAFIFKLSGAMQVVTAFLSLLIGCVLFADLEDFNEKYNY